MSSTPHGDSNKNAWLSQIFDEMGAMLLGYIRTILKDQHRAEDVLQNVFVRLLQAQSPITNLRSFVFTLAHNEAIREAKKPWQRKFRLWGQDRAIFEIAQPEKISLDEAICVQEALLSLPADQRQVVYLKIYGRLTFEEIAVTLEIPANTVASRYRYALEKMHQFLGESL